MSDTDQIFEIDSPATPRPLCPKCGMRMIVLHKPQPAIAHECLRCGHVEQRRR
jgi:ribosomal protein S27AE